MTSPCFSDLSKCNAKIKDPRDGNPMIIILFGYYVSWGLANHNPSRLDPLVKLLLKHGYGVQLQYDSKSADFVKLVLESDKTILTKYDTFQNSGKFHQRKEISIKLVTELQKKLGRLKLQKGTDR